jgi:16S rRNA (uracil1498-N3)-methyltransferase
MTHRRWIADEVSGDRAALLGPHADHLARVLRARVGQEFDIAVGDMVRRGRISAIHEGRIEFELAEEVPAASELPVTLALSIFKFDHMEWAIEKCTELGVREIVPLVAQRTDSHLATAALKRVERWRRIAREASEQSRRVHPPHVQDPIKLRVALELPGASRIFLAEFNASVSLKDALQPAADSVVIAVGPEGGWTQAEHQAFTAAGWIAASLGSTILRAETAAISALAIVAAERP